MTERELPEPARAPEHDAVLAALEALDGLDDAAKQRALTWLIAKLSEDLDAAE